MRVPILVNLLVRVALSAVVAKATKEGIPELNFSGVFNVFQLCFLLSLTVVPLPWASLTLAQQISEKHARLIREAEAFSVKRAGLSSKVGVDFINGIEGTIVDRCLVTRSLAVFAAKKKDKIQEGLYKSLVPVFLVCSLVLLASIVIRKWNPTIHPAHEAELFVSLTQAYISAVSFIWTMGTLYGEVDSHREVMRSAL
ncbi:MAG TPA: hypothetical protein VF584_25170 [Longimicrobium sp.]|jgi:hypothetical protein